MQVRRILLALAVLVAICGSVPQEVSAAKKKAVDPTVITPSETLKNATVNLYCRLKAGNKTYTTSGTGVVIGSSGVILTNAHVAQYFLLPDNDKRLSGWCNVRTGSPAKGTYEAEVLYLPQDWVESNLEEFTKATPKGTGQDDFALIKITDPITTPLTPLTLSTTQITTTKGAVNLAGYPTEGLSSNEVRTKLALVAASSTVSGISGFTTAYPSDVITIASSAAGSAGVSGGPVTDTANNLLGIVTSKSTGKKSTSVRAISIPYITRSLTTQTGLTLQILSTTGAVVNGDENAANDMELIEAIGKTLRGKK